MDEVRSIKLDELEHEFFMELVRATEEISAKPDAKFPVNVLDEVYEMLECEVLVGGRKLITWSPALDKLLDAGIISMEGTYYRPQYSTMIQITNTGRAYHRFLKSDEASRMEMTAYEYDVAISFAGSERKLAEKLATLLRQEGIVPFYDRFYEDRTWGEDLAVYFDDVFRKKSRYCVVFISDEYAQREWTNWELRSAIARAVAERGGAYILPVKIDDVELEGLRPTIGYLSMQRYSVEDIAKLLIDRINKDRN
jgi:hypothetical protein